MPYVKLDTGILDSTLWLSDANVRVVFITMLAMAKPDGMCEATAPGIARRANLSIESVRSALAELEAPDPDSRTLEDEGRRVRRVDGGYFIINYNAYREKDHTAAARMQAKRDRDRGGWDVLLERQSRRCGCCGGALKTPYKRFVVHDHNHETGVYRSLLCQSCNKLVGQYERGDQMLSEPQKEMCSRYVTSWSNYEDSDVTLRNVTQAEAEAEAEAKGSTYPESFERAWSSYPRRQGSNPKKGAYRAWRVRRKEGYSEGRMEAGAAAYARYVRADETEGTRFVMQAKTFFGPDCHFDQEWQAEHEPEVHWE